MSQLLLSGIGYVPTPNVHLDVWDCVESYTIHMLLACRLKITFTFCLKLIISFLVQLQHLLFHSPIVTPSLVRVGMPLPLQLCCISGLGQKGLLHNRMIPVWTPGNLVRATLASRGNSASKNLQQETQQPKCCLYKTPFVAAPVRETGDVIARTPPYAQLPTHTPKRARFFWFTSKGFLKRPISLKYWLLRPFSTRKPHAKAVPRKDYFMHLRTLKNTRKGRWVISPNYCASHPRRFWAVGDNSCSKIWRPLGLTLRCMPYGRGMLRILLQRIS